MKAALLVALSLATLAFVGVGSTPVAAEPGQKVKLVDRTLRCTTGVQGGVPVILVNGRSAYGEGGRLEWFAQAWVVAAGQAVPTRPGFQPTLAGLTAGWPPPAGFTSGGLSFHNRRCVATRERVGLSRRGLLGGAAGQLGDDYQCNVPRSFLIRIRAVFRDPVALRLTRDRAAYSTEGRIEHGQIAVQTLAKKPLLYMEVADTGRARIFTGRSCL